MTKTTAKVFAVISTRLVGFDEGDEVTREALQELGLDPEALTAGGHIKPKRKARN